MSWVPQTSGQLSTVVQLVREENSIKTQADLVSEFWILTKTCNCLCLRYTYGCLRTCLSTTCVVCKGLIMAWIVLWIILTSQDWPGSSEKRSRSVEAAITFSLGKNDKKCQQQKVSLISLPVFNKAFILYYFLNFNIFKVSQPLSKPFFQASFTSLFLRL